MNWYQWGEVDFAAFTAVTETRGEDEARRIFGMKENADPIAHFGISAEFAADFLAHYGTPRHSGRYPWGSGENPYQRYANFVGNVDRLRAKGLNDTEISKSMGMTSTRFRAKLMLANEELRKDRVSTARTLRDKGMSLQAIANRMGLPNESSVRSFLDSNSSARMEQTHGVINALKQCVDDQKYVMVSGGVENYLHVSETKMKNALLLMEEEGYKVSKIKVRQQGTGYLTTLRILTKDDVPFGEIAKNKELASIPNYYSEDHGFTIEKLEPPRPVDASRIAVRFAEEGGLDRDGTIEIRRGVADLDLHNALYAQVRIATKADPNSDVPTHYLKGMALYSDDLPDGVDIRFNSNKPVGTDLFGKSTDTSVFKPIKKTADPDNPFGATIKDDTDLIRAQRHYVDENGERQLSCLNIVNEEGNWGDWAKSLSSQFLSKQRPSLIKQQLDKAYDARRQELDEIESLNNPMVKAKLAESFADDCDAAASHLKGAAMPRQRTQVLLPFPNLKEDECYAPNFKDGETVCLVRFPHGGTFEIAELKVNNRFEEGRRLLKRPDGSDALDVIGVHPEAARKLSGADFDGDSVLVIPNNDKRVVSRPALEGLRDFSTDYYKLPETDPPVDSDHGFHKQKQMGSVSNLITDMTIKGATDEELSKAVRHSMVIIDAEKHHLDWKQSELDNDIPELKTKYQGGPKRGASTLISKASSEDDPYDRRLITNPKRMTPEQRERFKNGEKIYEETGRTYTDKNGKLQRSIVKSTKMAEVNDAFELSSGTIQESIYAQYANKLKHMANEARKMVWFADSFEYNPSAKAAYEEEVTSLNKKLYKAELNRPLEAKAQLLAGKWVQAAREADPSMDADDIKKLRGRKITEARTRVGAGKVRIDITEREWQAIQARAVSKTKLNKILNNADMDQVKAYAMPRTESKLSASKVARIKSMYSQGRTTAEIAEAIGVSVSTIQRAVND